MIDKIKGPPSLAGQYLEEATARRQAAADRLLSVADRVAAAGVEPMSMEEIKSEVKAARIERQQRAGGH